MSKQKQLIEYIIQDVLLYIMDEQDVTLNEALNRFYNSEVFEKIQDIETGLYLESSAYIYYLYQIEVQHGKLIQTEQ